ncbi:sensor histidine kinase [Spirosoma montaniterrae]|nr:sensor histidine kinase [Spirosoma montaniterrae]
MNPSSFSERLRHISPRLSIPFQAMVWLIYMSFPFLILSLMQVMGPRDVLKVFSIKVINDVLSIVFFYLNLHVLTPNVLKTRQLGPFILAFSVLMVLLYLADSLYFQFYLNDVLTDIARRLPTSTSMEMKPVWGVPLPIILISFLSLLMLTSVSSGLAIYRDRNQHIAAGQQMIIQKQEAELTSLKLQISPHFLFNTLNNLRWLARQKSDETEEAILRLSDMMRYMIYQVDKGPVTLAREIEYLEHYVELQTMRLTPNNRLTFRVCADDRQVLIEPLLFIHFVENAFKHGLHPEDDSPIEIRLTFSDGLLTFQTRNRILVNAAPSPDSGIGVQNIERRLALHYPDQHQLRIYQQNGLFCVDLTIQLTPEPHLARNV